MRRGVSAEQAAHARSRLAGLRSEPSPPGWVPPPDDLVQPCVPAPSVAPTPVASAEPARVGPRLSDRVRWQPGRLGAAGLCVVAVVAALLAGLVVLRSRPSAVPIPIVDSPGQAIGSPSPSAGGEVVVAVAGKVRRPGLIRLPAGARVDDAVRAAGGATGPVGVLNLARRLVDGEQVLVGVAPAGGSAGPAGSTVAGRLDLNTATVADLDGLPGIGPVLAQRIVEWRTEHGRFASVDQLREVSGIGESKYQSLKAKVAV